MSKTALRNALFGWFAMMFVAGAVSLVPAKVPAWTLPTGAGAPESLRDLGGKQVGVLIYTGKVACGAHTRSLGEAVQVQKLLKENPRYAVKLVYGEPTETGARELAAGYQDATILLDPEQKLAKELELSSSAVVLYRPNGRIIEVANNRQILPRPDVVQLLDRKTR